MCKYGLRAGMDDAQVWMTRRQLSAYHWCIFDAIWRHCGRKTGYHAYELSLLRHRTDHRRFKCWYIGKCGVNQLMCRKGGKCIPVAKICDGVRDCEEAEDEENCASVTDEIWLVGEKRQPKRNENFTLKCVAKGSADLGLSIHWFKRGRRESINITDKLAPQKTSSGDVHIKDTKRPSDAHLYIEEHRSGNRVVSFLRFAPVDSQDDGDYYCTSGTVSSSHYKLQAFFDGTSEKQSFGPVPS
ncbi:hypothetical protein ElyMa_000082400 [Elysia marginata]|uniref:Ig-like domain-containing protein n=1 Tax=Elysia marginata TaxID=1093978 RepID=A0AAV4EIU5_9GAST|nr:hypothetical protein ElyMa_000082400 [Elysia marginata]